MKILPNFIKVILLVIIISLFFSVPGLSFAQATPTPTTAAPNWVKDQEVTFVGKSASRSDEFLNWTLSEENYRWMTLPSSGQDPIQGFWITVMKIVVPTLLLFILAGAFMLMVTRGRSITLMMFARRFVFIFVLILLSYALIRFIYFSSDVIQGFFLHVQDQEDPTVTRNINSKDLLYIAFNYDFTGYRLPGIEYDESAFISLLLVKLTAITYYVMTALLLIRKIILWFFIIVSPVFPLLLFFGPVRNTAKIWIGEFFRWLLYAPLFAIFLHGLVEVWRKGIPMAFNFTGAGTTQTYPTAISILLGGPGQAIDISNSVNLKDTFALYVVALLMLWVVILLPFLLLQIFLDYLNNVSFVESPVVKKITNNSWFNKAYGTPQIPPGQPPQQPSPFGFAKSLPFFNKRSMEIPSSKSTSTSTFSTRSAFERATQTNMQATQTNLQSLQTNLQTIRETRDVLRLANLSVPKMRDIARYETSLQKHDTVSRTEVNRFHETLEKISKPTNITKPTDREKFTSIKEKLVTQQKQGDKYAGNVLAASKVSEQVNNKTKAVIPGTVQPGQKKEGLTNIKEIKLPQTNQVQQVSIEEYEDVKKMWIDNYRNMEMPVGPSGLPLDKHTFIQQDIDNITETINLLSSDDQDNVDRGMERVANILPFLLLGGFSKAEVISYLKAKLEAAKAILTGVETKKEEEDTLLDRQDKSKEGEAEKSLSAELPINEQNPASIVGPNEKSLEDLGGDTEKSGEDNTGGGTPSGMPPAPGGTTS